MPGSNVDCGDLSAYDVVDMWFRPHFIFWIVLAFVPLSLAQSNGCDILPSQPKQLLDQKFSGWQPKSLSDLSEGDKKLWLESNPKKCPGIAVGHFEQTDHVAYAILLVQKSGDDGSYKIIVLSKLSDGYAVRLLDHSERKSGPDSGLVISREPHGRYSEFGDAKSVRLKLDGVNVEWLEKSSVLYYWSHGMYRSIQTSD
jgi:hypothetical protein